MTLTQVLPEHGIVPPLVIEPGCISYDTGSDYGETGKNELAVGWHILMMCWCDDFQSEGISQWVTSR